MATEGTATTIEPVRGRDRGVTDRLRDCGLADWPSDCPTRRVISCPLCASHERRLVATHDRYGWDVGACACHECGLIYLARTFTYQGTVRFYRRHYRDLVNVWHDKPFGYDWSDETAAYRRLCEVYWPATIDWMDVGGDAINPERESVLLETFPVEHAFEFVSCCQTLDHLIDPVTAFHKFAQLTRSGGHLWIDWVDYRKTQELKADHPLNWTWATVRRAIPVRHWSYTHPVAIDDRHYGLLLTRA